jgi:integrase/recombinase XerD
MFISKGDVYYTDKFTGKRRKVSLNKILNWFIESQNLSEPVRKKESSTHREVQICSELMREYLEVSKPPYKSMKSYSSIKTAFNEFIRIAGDKPLSHYTTKDIDFFLNEKSKVSSYTARRCRIHIKAGFNQAVKWNYIEKNPFMDSIRIRIPESDLLYLTKVDFNKLMLVVEKDIWKDLYTFAVFTGLRLGEIINLKLDDVDINKKMIKVVSNSQHRTKSGKTGYVELADCLIPIVVKYRELNSVYLFEGECGKKQLNSYFVSAKFKQYVRKAVLNDRIHFHCLRKTYGKWMLDANVNIKFISQQLRHSSVNVTEDWYAKYLSTEYKGEVNKITNQ